MQSLFIADTSPPLSLQLFGNMVDHCFASCVDDFTTKALSTREQGCVTRCVQKSMATSMRLSERFQEQNAAQMGAGGQGGQGGLSR